MTAGRKPGEGWRLWGVVAQTAFAACLVFVAACRQKPQATPMVLFNEDGTHYFDWIEARHPGKDFTRADLVSYCERFQRGAVTHYLVNVNGMTGYYDSQALEWNARIHERMGTCGLSKGRPEHDRRIAVERQLAKDGLDPYAVFISEARKRGIVPWLSMRMNDIHNVIEEDNCSTAVFWKEHPEYRLDPGEPAGKKNRNWGRGLPFDYAHAAVRRRHLDGLREMLKRYDVDGVELDWMRHSMVFRPGHEREDAHFLTDFMREARRIVDAEGRARGRRLQVAARIASRPEASRALGFDFEAWAREDLVDVLVACNDFLTADGGMSAREWKPLLAAANPHVRFVAGMDLGLAPECSWDVRRNLTLAEQTGWIERHLADGADGLYFFNYHYLEPDQPAAVHLLAKDWTPARFASLSRDYVVTMCDAAPVQELKDKQFGPVGAQRRDVKVQCGRRPTSGEVAVTLAFSQLPRPSTTDSLRFNGRTPASVSPGDPNAFTGDAKNRKGKAVVRAVFPREAMRDGENVVSVLGDGRPDGSLHACRIEVRPDVTGKN